MEECNICLTKKKLNKNKHEQSKKHKYSWNLFINKYIKNSDKIDNIKDLIQPFYEKHKKKFDDFTVCVMSKKNDMLINKSSIPSTITLEKLHLFGPNMIELPIVIRVSTLDFLDTIGSKLL